MLQRIQSVFLLITAVCLSVFLATNTFIKSISPSDSVIANPYHIYHVKGTLLSENHPIFYVAVVAALALAVTIFTIFQYKNRVRQMLFVALNSLMIGTALAIMVYHIQNDAMKMGDENVQGTYGVGMWAAFIALLCNWLANRFIKKDEKLVKSADRMR